MNERTFRSRRPRSSRRARAPGRAGRGPSGGAKGLEARARILASAEPLFARKGFAATTAREIADGAGMALGNLYNYFRTKEAIFEAVMADLSRRYRDPAEPVQQVLATMRFPWDLEKLGAAVGGSFERFHAYVRLMYVDVLEFDGVHLR